MAVKQRDTDPKQLEILWRDDTALAVNKPSGILVHNSRYAGRKEVTMRQLLLAQMGAPMYPIHRIDRPASGVVLFARERQWVQPWHEQLVASTSVKLYLALVRGYVREPQMIDHAIRDGGKRYEARSDVVPLLISPSERCSLVGVVILSGRRHQVRRHLAHISHPIIGDTTYGKGAINRHYRTAYEHRRLGLHACLLIMKHPFSGDEIIIQASIPPELMVVWTKLFDMETLQDAVEKRLSAMSIWL